MKLLPLLLEEKKVIDNYDKLQQVAKRLERYLLKNNPVRVAVEDTFVINEFSVSISAVSIRENPHLDVYLKSSGLDAFSHQLVLYIDVITGTMTFKYLNNRKLKLSLTLFPASAEDAFTEEFREFFDLKREEIAVVTN